MPDLLPRTLLLWGCLLAILTGFLPAQPPQAPPKSDQESKPKVLVVPIEDAIDLATVVLVRKTLRYAKQQGVDHVVLNIDTPGGRLDALRELQGIVSGMEDSGITPVAFVSGQATSAGALLAFACERVFMRSASTIGASTPVQSGPLGVRDIPDKDLRRKLISYERAQVRALLERRKDKVKGLALVAQAMIDPDMQVYHVMWRNKEGFQDEVAEFVDEAGLQKLRSDTGKEIIGKEEKLPGQPVTLTADEALRFRVSNGTYGSIQEMISEELHFESSEVEYWRVGWSERGIAWLNWVKPVLFVLGFILLLIELKTPGFLVPGVLGLILISIAFYASYQVGTATWGEILLFFVGLGLLAIEIFVMPGILIAATLGFLCIVLGMLFSLQNFGLPEEGNEAQQEIFTDNLWLLIWMFGGILIGTILFYRNLDRVPFLKRAIQQPTQTGVSRGAATKFENATSDDSPLLGKVGIAVTDMRPAGIIEIGHGRHDVVTRGAFLQKGQRVQVVEVRGNRIVVEATEGPADEGNDAAQSNPESGEASTGFLILLLILSFALFIAEVFFVSFGVLGLVGSVAVISAVFYAFTEFGEATGWLVLCICAVGIPGSVFGALRILPRTKFGQNYFLSPRKHEEVHAGSEEPGLDALLNKTGVTTSALRPSGFARIDGQRVDVVTRGESIDEGQPIQVIQVDSNRVIVAPEQRVID